jgi:hypothetical protein
MSLTTISVTDLPPDAQRDLRAAFEALENPSLAARLAALAGMPIEALRARLPTMVQGGLDGAVRAALQLAIGTAMRSGPAVSPLPVPSAWFHRGMAAASGAIGGAFGLPGTLIELPVSTTILLRQVAAVAGEEGEDLAAPEAAAECLKVFALGGTTPADDATESGYFAVRIALAEALKGAVGRTIVPGFVAQHDHPVLAALTMSSEILSIEDWALPTGTVAAVKDKQDFIDRLTAAVAARTNPDEPVVTWGYHPAFYGELTRAELDTISSTRPILVWGRSCHEFFLNSATLERAGLTGEAFDKFPESAKAQANVEDGHFWEQGMFALLGKGGSALHAMRAKSETGGRSGTTNRLASTPRESRKERTTPKRRESAPRAICAVATSAALLDQIVHAPRAT